MDVTIKRTIFGYYQVEPKTRRLSNFMFQAHSILGKDGNDDETKFISGRIVTPEFSHDITLPDYAFDSTAGLALQIWRSLVTAGHSDFQPCLQSSVESIGWRNVFLMFDDAPCISESAVLGISGDYFAYPSVRIAVDGQQEAGLLPEALRRRYGDMYGAVTPSAEPSAPVMRRLLMSREPAITAMRELLAWLLHETVAASVAGKDFRAGHILVPYYSLGDDNARILTGLAEMFNGCPGIRTIHNEKESGKLCDDAKRMGRLPVIFAVKGKMEPEPWLRRLDSSAIILCPAGTCMKMNATADIRFMAAQETGQAIAPDIFRAVLGAWPDMLITARQLIVEHSRAPVDQFGGSLLAMFARKLHASYRDPQLFSERYVPPVANTRTISRILNYLVETGAVTLAGTEWAFRKGRDSDVGYRAKDMVRIRPRTLRAAFDSCIPGVKVASLQKCLEERFGVTGVSSRGELEIPASTWQEQLRLHVPVRQITAEDLGFKDNEDDCIEVKSECLPEPR